MTFDEMNDFILNYIKYDITGRALMLSGGWGTGKSHYVRYSLKPFLEDKRNGGYKCAIVSLYGLSGLADISKAIYTELRSIGRKKCREWFATAGVATTIASKTIYNALISYIGYDIGKASERSINNVYYSLDLRKKLVVLEDVERSNINIQELFGFVYNMCDSDGAKVLLVTNEQDLTPYTIETKEDTKGINAGVIGRKVYSQSALEYFKVKEKTVSDTIKFSSVFRITFGEIIDMFHSDDLNCYKETIDHDILRKQLVENESVNYREVIQACQKTCDIFRYITEHRIIVDEEFKKCIFIGLINYAQKRLQEPGITFNTQTMFDPRLSGNDVYPLLRFCFEYYNSQMISEKTIIETYAGYKEYLLYLDKPAYGDKDLGVLYNYLRSSEEDLSQAVKSIHSRLDTLSDLSFYHYDRIINHLLVLKYDVKLKDIRIDESINKMINNLKGRGAKLQYANRFFTSTIVIQDPEGEKEFSEIKSRVYTSLASSANQTILLTSEDLAKKISELSKEDLRKYNSASLVEMIPIEKVGENLKKFTSGTLDDLRHIIWQLNIGELSDDSISAIVGLRNKMQMLKDDNKNGLDRVQRMQLNWMCDAIDKKMTIK